MDQRVATVHVYVADDGMLSAHALVQRDGPALVGEALTLEALFEFVKERLRQTAAVARAAENGRLGDILVRCARTEDPSKLRELLREAREQTENHQVIDPEYDADLAAEDA
jgi:hypothetical protein